MKMQARAYVLLALPFILAFPSVAVGLSAPVPGAALLAFGAVYEEGGRTQTHRGLDLACSAGDAVLAPCEGDVTFAGMVPGTGGGTVLAVTVVAADGLKLTLLPLERAAVAAGERVSEGAPLGEVASGGDASCDSPHLHLSARRGELYVDPAPLLASAAAEAPVPESGAAPADPVCPPPSARPVPASPSGPVVADAGRARTASRRQVSEDPAGADDRAPVPSRPERASVGETAMRPSQAAQIPEPVEQARRVRQRSGATSDGTAWILAAAAGACALGGIALRNTMAPARLRESDAA